MNWRLFLLLAAVALVAVGGSLVTLATGEQHAQAHADGGQDPAVVLGCCHAAFCPKAFTFYGNERTLLEDLDQFIEPQVKNRRVYAFLIETDATADVLVVERDGKSATVAHRSGPPVIGLAERVHDMMLANRGVLCVGEQTKQLLATELGDGLVRGEPVPAPASARAVVLHTLRQHPGSYLRLTVFLLC